VTSAAILALLERTTKRFKNFRDIGTLATAMKSDVCLHPMEWWEPADEALLRELIQAINQSRGCQPLPLLEALPSNSEES
jgi:hypothetical protein